MTKLDAVIERLRALPADQQTAFAFEIEGLLDAPESALSPEQWAQVDAALREPDGELMPHARVVAEMRAKFE